VYQLAGNVYKALEQPKDAEKLYKRAIKKFPNSGALYSEYGELLWAVKDYSAIELWERGIRQDPSFAGNYYNAALFYYYTKDKVWSLLYGEIFVNMENLTERAVNMKKLLLDGYKQKLFADADLMAGTDKNTPEFAKAFLQTAGKQASLVNRGITTEILTMVRTRFILDWFATHGAKYPFKLFDYQQQLLKEGMFEAYNQWLFGTVESLPAYDNWIKTHAEAHTAFTNFQKNRVFKIPPGQYYGK
jgi:tetratricopeptide (TPR) repeat protein